jgi:ABC-type transport system involved in cytochrome bd biosynthesis fused ATPase/permease subunit
VVAVTHDASAIPASRRVILLNHGRVIADSTYRALRKRRDLALAAAWA